MRKIFTLFILLLLLPVTALAATVENITYLDENGTQQTAASATQVTNSDTQWTDGWYVAQSNITIDGTVTISGNVHLILEDGCNLTVNGGILLQSDSNMYIYAQSTEKERMGSLTATGTDAGFKEAGSGTQTLTIAGGKISASGSDVGISAVNLTITDGYVSALGTDLNGTSIAVYNATISGGFVDLYGKFAGTLSTGIDGHAVISSTGEIKNIAADCKGFFLIQKSGKIYGDTFTLTQDLNIANSNIVVTVEEGQTLTLDNGVTLTIPYFATLTNNGTLNNNGTIINTGTMYNSGTLNNNGTLNNTNVLNNAGSIINNGTLTGEVGGSGTVITTPTITTQPTAQTVTEGATATFTVEATGGNLSYQWQQSTDNGSRWTNIESATNATYTIETTTMDMSGTQYRCVVKNTINEETSEAATLTVKHNLVKVEAETPTCTEPGNIEYWHCEGCGKYFKDENATEEITFDETIIKAAGHNEELVGAKEATCTEEGYTGDKICTVCKAVLKKGTVIPAIGHKLTKTEAKSPTCTEDGNIEYWTCSVCNVHFSDEAGTTEIKLEDVDIPATGHHYVNGYCTECGHRDPDYRPDPISYYNIYVEDVCDGVEVSTSKPVVREGGSITVYVEKDTANYTFDNFKVYYKEGYYDSWDELKEGTQPGEYPIKNIWTHIYIKAEGAEEKEDPTGIESIEGVKVYTKDGSLYVQTPQREQVIIISMSGAVVKNEEQIGLKQYHGLQPGIYIVRVGDRAYKVRLN